MTTVYATLNPRAERFHKTPTCPSFHNGQLLSDMDCGCYDHCYHRMPRMWRLKEMTVTDALGRGKWPCTYCWPGSAAALAITPCEEDFGHVPVNEYAGTPEGQRGASRIVCARCIIWNRWKDVGMWAGQAVGWPCTSAIVLGLVPRPVKETS